MKLKHRKRLLRLASLLDRSAARLRRYVKAKTPKRVSKRRKLTQSGNPLEEKRARDMMTRLNELLEPPQLIVGTKRGQSS